MHTALATFMSGLGVFLTSVRYEPSCGISKEGDDTDCGIINDGSMTS